MSQVGGSWEKLKPAYQVMAWPLLQAARKIDSAVRRYAWQTLRAWPGLKRCRWALRALVSTQLWWDNPDPALQAEIKDWLRSESGNPLLVAVILAELVTTEAAEPVNRLLTVLRCRLNDEATELLAAALEGELPAGWNEIITAAGAAGTGFKAFPPANQPALYVAIRRLTVGLPRTVLHVRGWLTRLFAESDGARTSATDEAYQAWLLTAAGVVFCNSKDGLSELVQPRVARLASALVRVVANPERGVQRAIMIPDDNDELLAFAVSAEGYLAGECLLAGQLADRPELVADWSRLFPANTPNTEESTNFGRLSLLPVVLEHSQDDLPWEVRLNWMLAYLDMGVEGKQRSLRPFFLDWDEYWTMAQQRLTPLELVRLYCRFVKSDRYCRGAYRASLSMLARQQGVAWLDRQGYIELLGDLAAGQLPDDLMHAVLERPVEGAVELTRQSLSQLMMTNSAAVSATDYVTSTVRLLLALNVPAGALWLVGSADQCECPPLLRALGCGYQLQPEDRLAGPLDPKLVGRLLTAAGQTASGGVWQTAWKWLASQADRPEHLKSANQTYRLACLSAAGECLPRQSGQRPTFVGAAAWFWSCFDQLPVGDDGLVEQSWREVVFATAWNPACGWGSWQPYLQEYLWQERARWGKPEDWRLAEFFGSLDLSSWKYCLELFSAKPKSTDPKGEDCWFAVASSSQLRGWLLETIRRANRSSVKPRTGVLPSQWPLFARLFEPTDECEQPLAELAQVLVGINPETSDWLEAVDYFSLLSVNPHLRRQVDRLLESGIDKQRQLALRLLSGPTS